MGARSYAGVWQKKIDEWSRAQEEHKRNSVRQGHLVAFFYSMSERSPLGLAAGDKMRQEIYPDPYNLEDWGFSPAERVFETHVNAKYWLGSTGEAALDMPPTESEYSKAGLHWFKYYGIDQTELAAGKKLAQVRPVSSIFKALTGTSLPNSGDIPIGKPVSIGPGTKAPRSVQDGKSCD